MDLRKQRLTIEEAKQMDMVDYLYSLGYKPSKVRNNNYWYLSPLRNESTPSFKVNWKINKWYDHGLGRGGNLIDFGILYHQCTVSELLHKININFSFHQPIIHTSNQANNEHAITILQDYLISSYSLLQYLEQRKIPLDIAEEFCKEVRYKLNDKIYYGIGFKNDLGGYEIRNPYFKTSSSPKGITTFGNGSKETCVFEGFIDFLSFIAMHKNQAKKDVDYVILNSVSFFEKARLFMEQHDAIKLYLDRDTTGQNCSQYAISISNRYKDESHLYKNHKDLNEWWVGNGQQQKAHLKSRLR